MPFICLLATGAFWLGGCGANQEEATDNWQSVRRLAFQDFRDNKFSESIEKYKQAVALAEKLIPSDRRLALTLNDLARTYAVQKDFKNAAATYERSLFYFDKMQNSIDIKTDGTEAITGLIDSLEGLGNAMQQLNKPEQADKYYRRALNVLTIAGEPKRKRDILYEYRSFLRTQGRVEDAQKLDDATDHVASESQLPNPADALSEEFTRRMTACDEGMRTGNLAAALQECKYAVLCARKLRRPLKLADAQTQLAGLMISQHQFPEGEYMYQSALQSYAASEATEKQMYGCLLGYSQFLIGQNRAAQAEPFAKRAYTYSLDNHSADEHEVAATLSTMAGVYSSGHKWEKALPLQRKLLEITRRHSDALSPDAVMQTCYTANLYALMGKDSAAKSLLNKFIADSEKQKASKIVVPARLFTDFGAFCLKQSQPREATLFLDTALRLLKRTPNELSEIKRTQDLLKAARHHS